jgi:hypothetical protein
MPGDVSVTIPGAIQISGTGSIFDQTYEMKSVKHHFTAHDGYVMEISGYTAASGGGQ